ncbi:MAG: T9SS type A sorting domain-containing protein [Bacteroidia bacterium]|nr:T9SS type A sorting domain-containing protein [Bacteroidia bacterium]
MKAKLIHLLLTGCLSLGALAQNPAWTTQFDTINSFGSPQCADLNGDGVRDIILGGGVEDKFTDFGVVALNGINGNLLWALPARDQVYITPLLRDINADGVEDIFIGGRDALFWALDGATGQVIWEFWPDSAGSARDSGWYNFYNPQWVPDQDQDNFPDLLIANGGDAKAPANDPNRPVGSLMLLSTLTGNIIARDTMPDGQETYMSPLVYDQDASGDPWIYFGSGGETLHGSFWKVKLSDLKNNDISGAMALITDTSKGFVPVPSATDLNQDQVPDLVVPWFNAGLIALDGKTDSVIWQLHFPGYENYNSPTLGNFTGDPTPDVFGMLAKGQWFFYAHFVRYLVDGATGQVVWSDTSSTLNFTQAVALDFDLDGRDEIITQFNFDLGSTTLFYQNQMQVLDFQGPSISNLGNQRNGLNLFSTPLIADLDGDSLLEIVYTYLPATSDVGGAPGTRIERLNLGFWRDEVAWSGYMGNARDGLYLAPIPLAREDELVSEKGGFAYPNPTTGKIWWKGDPFESAQLFDARGQLLLTHSRSGSLDLSGFPAGIYILQVRTQGGDFWQKVSKM